MSHALPRSLHRPRPARPRARRSRRQASRTGLSAAQALPRPGPHGGGPLRHLSGVGEPRDPKSGRKIDLNIVVLPALSPNPAPDPIIYINGGPGYGSTGAAGGFAADPRRPPQAARPPLRRPARHGPVRTPCTATSRGATTISRAIVRDLFPLDALKACEPQARRRRGPHPVHHADRLDDLDEVRAWLGYERLNVFGGSYGTRAAQVYMRRHPEHVRSAILAGDDDHGRQDAVLPRPQGPGGARQAVRRLRRRRRLPRRLPRSARRARQGGRPPRPGAGAADDPRTRRPASRSTLSISKGAFTTTLRSMQYSPFLSVRIPLYLHLRRPGRLRARCPRMTVRDRTDPGWDIGLYLSITCAEDVARIDPTDGRGGGRRHLPGGRPHPRPGGRLRLLADGPGAGVVLPAGGVDRADAAPAPAGSIRPPRRSGRPRSRAICRTA